jgi:hypothetical protein
MPVRDSMVQELTFALMGLKPPALSCKACLRRLVEAAQAVFVPVSGFSHRVRDGVY